MKIQIAISTNFGAFYQPKGFETNSFRTEWRIELAKYLAQNATVSKKICDYDKEKGGIQLIRKKDGQILENLYYFNEATTDMLPGELATLTVVEVDTNDDWIISEYDGAESIEDVPQYRRVDKYGYHEIR